MAGCRSVKLYDKEVCGDLGADGAHCQHTYINQTRDIPKAEWDRVRVGFMCMDSDAFTDTENALDQICLRLRCDYRTREAVAQVRQSLHEVADIAQEARRAGK